MKGPRTAGAASRVPQPPRLPRLTRSRSSLPALKNGTAFSSTSTEAPVRGLRPSRASRFLTEKAPKPRSSTRSPRASAAVISLNTVATIVSTSRAVRCGLAVASSAIEFRLGHALVVDAVPEIIVVVHADRVRLPNGRCQNGSGASIACVGVGWAQVLVRQQKAPDLAAGAALSCRRPSMPTSILLGLLVLPWACWLRRRIAAPRMSPSEAPLSEEPNSAIACLSSSTSLPLIESWSLRAARSIAVTLASTFSPTAKRSGRCSDRSRARSARRMKPVSTVVDASPRCRSDWTAVTVQVTTSPLCTPSSTAAARVACSCLMPRQMRSFSTSMSSTLALTISPFS